MRLRTALVALAAACIVAPVARANGDPASDYLLSQDVFVPFDAKISSERSAQLTALVAEAKKRGYEIRVALIVTPYDLGSVPSLFRKPQRYALFLGQELFFVYRGRLLVVMPNGYGLSVRGKPLPRARRVADTLPSPGEGGDAVARAALVAVQRLTAQAGLRLSVPATGRAHSSHRDRITLIVVFAVAATLLGALAAARRLRAR